MQGYDLRKLIAVLLLYSAWTYANNSKPFCNVKRIDITTADNPFIRSMVSKINSDDPENLVDLIIEVKEEISTDMLAVKFTVSIDGQQMGDAEKDFCDLFDDDLIGKDLIDHGVDEFPKNCPVPPGEHKIVKYKLDTQKLNGVPDGKFQGNVIITDSAQETSYVTIEFEGELFH